MNVQNHLSPRQLAAAIGVSESSLKRWADEGRLTVERTAGGHRRISLREAVQFIRRSDLKPVRPELLGLPGVSADLAHDPRSAAEFLVTALRGDHATEARSLLISLYAGGSSLAWLCDEVVRTALVEIGELWQHGPHGIFIEHRATDTCVQVLAHLRMLVPEPDPSAPAAVGCAFERDVYRVPSSMAALILAEAGYGVHDLGPDTPVPALVSAIEHHHPELIWVSCSTPPSDPREAGRTLDSLARVVSPGTLVVGGRGLDSFGVLDSTNMHRLGSMAELAAYARGAMSRRPVA